MKTENFVHLRMTQADRCTPGSGELISGPAWRTYRNAMLVREGFDMTRPITSAGTSFDVVYSQQLEPC